MKNIEYIGKLENIMIEIAQHRDCIAISIPKSAYLELAKLGAITNTNGIDGIYFKPIIYSIDGSPVQFICHSVCPRCGEPIK